MSDIHIERSLATLISEQMTLVTRQTPLTEAEKCEFRARAKKIRALLGKTRNEHARKSVCFVVSIAFILVVLIVLAAYWKPRFVHADNPSPYVLFDRVSRRLCWSGPLNDLQAFMNGSLAPERLPRKPKDLPICRALTE